MFMIQMLTPKKQQQEQQLKKINYKSFWIVTW